MREQVVIPRAQRNAGASTQKWRSPGAPGQKPLKRPQRANTSISSGAKNHQPKMAAAVAAAMPVIGKVLLVVVACMLIISAYRAAASAAFFQLRKVDVSGIERSSNDDVQAIVRRMSREGVWRTDLKAISAEIKRRQGWVREAVVTRVLPDGIRVRVMERSPRAVVRSSSGRLTWVDEEAVALGEVSPSMPQLPAFFIHGFDESGTDVARKENRERMAKYLEMSRDWEAAGMSERVSEVNLIDVRDVRAQLSGQDSRIEVRLGNDNFGQRLRRALKALDDGRNSSPRGSAITYIDATLYPKVTLGFSAGAHGETTGNAVAAVTTVRK